MIRAAVGLSAEPNTARAALEAAGQILQQLDGVQPDWCVVFATDEHTGFDLEQRPPLQKAGPLVFADDPTHEELVEAALVGNIDLDSSLDPDPIDIHREVTARLDPVPTDALPLLALDEIGSAVSHGTLRRITSLSYSIGRP